MAWTDSYYRYPDPGPDEFASWLAPEDCFGHLSDGVPDQELVNRLLKRLHDGKLVAAATEARWIEGGKRREWLNITAVDPPWWLNALDVQVTYSPIWRLGEFTCRIEQPGTFDENVAVNFYGVKFEPGEMLHTVPGLRARRPLIPKIGGGYLGPGDPLHCPPSAPMRQIQGSC